MRVQFAKQGRAKCHRAGHVPLGFVSRVGSDLWHPLPKELGKSQTLFQSPSGSTGTWLDIKFEGWEMDMEGCIEDIKKLSTRIQKWKSTLSDTVDNGLHDIWQRASDILRQTSAGHRGRMKTLLCELVDCWEGKSITSRKQVRFWRGLPAQSTTTNTLETFYRPISSLY